MNSEQYPYTTNPGFLDFEFTSEGPNGKIRKVVRYISRNANGIIYFNLAFGDLEEGTGRINDLARSGNKDTNKILFTVGATVLEFTERFPDAIIYAMGSTPARTRLYQMGIIANWDQIAGLLEVYGFTNGNWEEFAKNVNYHALLVFRKKV